MIFTPGNPSDPAYWAAVFAGHVAVGVGLAVICGGTFGRLFGRPAVAGAQIATIGYALIWEAWVQALGEGLGDAALDSFAVALGAVIASAAWERRGAVLSAALLLAMVSVWLGIWRRM